MGEGRETEREESKKKKRKVGKEEGREASKGFGLPS